MNSLESMNITALLEEAKKYTNKGKVASYIPELKKANSTDLGIAVITPDNKMMSAGQADVKFTLQSISKVISLALAIMDKGTEFVFSRVGMEPTGDPFNSIIKLETSDSSKPLNPMINAGALAVTNMIEGECNIERMERLLHFVRELTNNPAITYSNEVAKSELETAFLNRSLCYHMKQNHIIDGDVEELMDLYTMQCSIEVNCHELARIGLIFAMDGYDPLRKKQLIPRHIAKICKTFMVTCGMYNASGEFAIRVGIPAKSGVSGGIVGCIKGEMGIGIYSPALDEKGNSIAGMKLLELLSAQEGFNMF
ncbi:glutaminase A [Priestia taiwanensis]|uniref:Glutaminase n=1 Tax=Priestia taiwanensis TaxID=1347902 RepID=A0A917AW65_9BACI|nr:glutaminase A [Priestia taiwanensis]MBM7364644.1 glutaminase [Priestia taiwanensis]GGE78472.1 glutaminase 1 [Priestia taiwanensis]